jgi:ferrous iron transport protein A
MPDRGVPYGMTTLDKLQLRHQARVILIDGGHGVRAHLNSLGIHIGDWVRVMERAPFGGPVLIEVHGTRFAVGRGLAAKVRVDLEGVMDELEQRDRQLGYVSSP